jgi:predicted nucleic acid-binding protein
MKLLLDTTYFLPAIGISIRGLPRDAYVKLVELGHLMAISDITFFELTAKGAKYVAAGALEADRVSRGVKAIVYDERVSKIPIYDGAILRTAFKLRSSLNDFIDCLILSSAVNQSDALITEDADILELREKGEFQELIQAVNPKFTVQTLKDVL